MAVPRNTALLIPEETLCFTYQHSRISGCLFGLLASPFHRLHVFYFPQILKSCLIHRKLVLYLIFQKPLITFLLIKANFFEPLPTVSKVKINFCLSSFPTSLFIRFYSDGSFYFWLPVKLTPFSERGMDKYPPCYQILYI